MELPAFRYHPDPVATGSVRVTDSQPCLCCSRIRGAIYDGPVYSERFHNLSGAICPWCIAEGSAAKRFGAEFSYAGALEGISAEVREELALRTPGYTGWQQEQWLCCCGEPAAYLGTAGAEELDGEFGEAKQPLVEWLMREMDSDEAEAGEFVAGLHRDGDATAYVFQCLRCGEWLAYADRT